jgi:hypothetical protein
MGQKIKNPKPYHIILASPKIALENIATYTNPNEDKFF